MILMLDTRLAQVAQTGTFWQVQYTAKLKERKINI